MSLGVFCPGCNQPDQAMTVRRQLLPALVGLGLVLMQAPGALQAQQGPPESRLTPQQQEQLFPEQKALWLKHARARIAALQSGERCVQAARSAQALKRCLQQERQSNMSLRRSHWAEMRALFARYGIQLPERPERNGGERGQKHRDRPGSSSGSAGAEI